MKAHTSAAISPREQEWRPLLTLATQEVFEIMLGSFLTTAETPDVPRGENFTAMVGLAGSLRGVVTFCCGAPSAEKIAATMLGLTSPAPKTRYATRSERSATWSLEILKTSLPASTNPAS